MSTCSQLVFRSDTGRAGQRWAERAECAAYPERLAREALGHNSKAVPPRLPSQRQSGIAFAGGGAGKRTRKSMGQAENHKKGPRCSWASNQMGNINSMEARLLAESWVREEVKNVPEVVGAILAGSIRGGTRGAAPRGLGRRHLHLRERRGAERHRRPRGRFAPRKLLYRGVVLEPSFHPAARIADPEVVLGDMLLAPAFTEPIIALDPSGQLLELLPPRWGPSSAGVAMCSAAWRRRLRASRPLARGPVRRRSLPCAPPAGATPRWPLR